MLLESLEEDWSGAGSLADWHLEQAEKAELEALASSQPNRRRRLLAAAKHHRERALAAREEEN